MSNIYREAKLTVQHANTNVIKQWKGLPLYYIIMFALLLWSTVPSLLCICSLTPRRSPGKVLNLHWVLFIEFSVDCMITAVISLGLRLAISTTPDVFGFLLPYIPTHM